MSLWIGVVMPAFFFHLGAVHAAEDKAGWQTQWEKTLQAAKKEGQISIYGVSGYDEVFREFQKKYPEIKTSFVGGLGSQHGPRVMNERRAGKYLVDIYVAGIVTPYSVFYRGRALEPIRPVLILPEVLDESKWWGGEHHYADPEGAYIFVFQGNVHGGENAYNTKLVDPKEFKSYWDFLHPRWKGKIVARDPKAVSTVAHSLRFFYHHPEIGPEFIKRLFGEMDVTLSRDERQMLDWLAVGKFPIAFFIGGVQEVEKQGLPVKMFEPISFKEGASVGPTQGSVSLFNRAPHPNAAKLAINWLLSRDGQIAYQKAFAQVGDIRESMREDISKDVIPPAHRRVKGAKYIYSGRVEWVDMGPVNKVVNETLGRSK
jgi:iron(III) transport system substrate-binding protein